MKAAWQASMPVFKHIAKMLAGIFSAGLWVALNIILCDSVGAILVLWSITAICVIVAIQYHRVVYQREEEERTKRYYEKRDADWQAKYGYPYPYSR